eukprot:4106077-Ditylum_brightwellii.AAC.1
MYSDADLARKLKERRSTTSIALVTNGIATHWDILKQGGHIGAATSIELFARHKGIFKVSDIHNFSSSIGYSIEDPSTFYEDNISMDEKDK